MFVLVVLLSYINFEDTIVRIMFIRFTFLSSLKVSPCQQFKVVLAIVQLLGDRSTGRIMVGPL